ncbi:MAG: TatD family nuclease-associated radical SAM protein [Myxococcales bacterium]
MRAAKPKVTSLPKASPSLRCVYRLGTGVYLNLTNRCTLACTFCPRTRGDFEPIAGNALRLSWEPNASEVIARLLTGWPFGTTPPTEVVFCGLGEPTLRWAELLLLASWIRHAHPGLPLRLDTDGLASLRQGHDVTAELGDLFDSVSVSLNAPDPATYVAVCPSRYGAAAHQAAIDFLRSASRRIASVRATVVAVPEVDLAATQELAKALGVSLLVRPFGDIARHPLAVVS